MQQHLPSLRLRMLPSEIIHDIVREAWLTIVDGDWDLRWDFYHTISVVSRSFSAAMQNAALRAVAIRTPEDLTKYRCLVKRRFGLDPESKDGDERAHPAAIGFFAHSELHIVLADWICPGSGFQYRTEYVQIPRYIPVCKYLQVLVKELPSNDQYTLPYKPLFQLLSQYTGTRHMSLHWAYTHSNRYILPSDPVVGVTYLRMREYPRCVCHNRSQPIYHNYPAGDARRAHSTECFSFYLPKLFPQLRHLHFDTPFFLKNISTPPSVVLLTIEVPPVHFTRELGRFSSLSPWNIVSALSYGFFRTVRVPTSDDPDSEPDAPPPPRKKIIVNTGSKDPSGLAGCSGCRQGAWCRHRAPPRLREPTTREKK
ncbi:hypothetical protein LXA43DRAFT_87400 [Ganoderma leucocontextum]|nr:hypothetical protein LXA43DRAFT_87400 [Ganoderma leucocontextum]